MHRTKDALKLLSSLLSRVLGPRQQHLFFGLARLYAKHGLNKDALIVKLPSLCNNPPDRRTWELLKSMAVCPCLARATVPTLTSKVLTHIPLPSFSVCPCAYKRMHYMHIPLHTLRS